jgi:7-cyano-7-deazaguanine synthase
MSLSPAPRCNVLLSGGIDSALVASLLCREGWSVQALWVDYEQPAAEAERAASRAIAAYYGLEWHEAAVRGVPVPSQGEVPGRNDLLIATAHACVPGLAIAIGVHAGTPYADCTTQWLDAWHTLLDVQHSGTVTLLAPLAAMHKPQVLALAHTCAVPLDLTHSCETGPVPCGRCLSCQDRQVAVAGA